MADLPELLAPAGTPAALEAAVEAGADAIYFGGSAFNARMGAKNFDDDSLRESVKLAHAYGVKCYMTLNTLVYDRELDSCLSVASSAAESGIDALIVADLGVASLIHKAIPDLPLHASTQASGHRISAAAELSKLGFSRMVMAREATLDDIRAFTKSSTTELEVFVHGALCVCHSGQCLFSSLVGGRSGNRGECAQPCRLPYRKGNKEYYPLSLKDLCLACHVPELIDAKVSSLKIEGRMKPPEYVLAVTRVWRKLLDERRAATPDEMKYLAEIFSRGGFTDGYFKGRLGSDMLGVRSEQNKTTTRQLPPFTGIKRKIKLDINAAFKADLPSSLTLSTETSSVSVTGDTPQTALTAPMSADDFARNLTKLGGTPYEASNIKIDCDDGLMLPVSRLNALRRSAVEKLCENPSYTINKNVGREAPTQKKQMLLTASFLDPSQISDTAKEYFDILYLPLDRYDGSVNGVVMPPVIFDHETEYVDSLLKKAKELGATEILIGNIAHIELAKKHGFNIHGDLRLNVTNTQTVAALEKLGFSDMILSPELTLPQLRDIKGNTSAVVYGRLPMMLLEKCAICEVSGCNGKSTKQLCYAELTDRKGVSFPILREGLHRNVIYNSLPTNMSDRADELTRYGISSKHFIFSTEKASEVDRVISVFRSNTPLPQQVRRINK